MFRRFPALKFFKGKKGLNFLFSSSSQNNSANEFLAEGESIDGYFKFPRETLTKNERSELLNSLTGMKKGTQKYREATPTPVYKENDNALKNFLSRHQAGFAPEKEGAPKKITLVSKPDK